MSDGSQRLYFRDPKTFQLIKTIEVYSDQGPINYLNELEYIEGLVYANIWMANSIAVIDPLSGKTMAIINADELVSLQKQGLNGNVLNGIAYNSTNKKLYLTGKYWSKLFEVQILK
jgi:glutamine cyclotransferase